MLAAHCSPQNADDCTYPESLALRMLELVVTPRGVSLLSNEAGFSVKDVEGICNISRSKKEGVAGYTGEWGDAGGLCAPDG
jgi:hypothetical protein